MTLLDLLHLLRKHLGLTITLPILFVVGTAAVSWTMLPNTYTATVSMYVLANVSSSDSYSYALETDLYASQMITNDVAELIQSNLVLDQAAEQVGLDSDEIEDYDVDVTSSTETRLITLEVTGDSAASATAVANAIASTTNTVAQEIMEIEAVNIIDEASTPDEPSGPPRILYVAAALFAGIFIAISIVVLMDVINTRIRKPEEIEELLEIPVIGRIPVIK